MAVSSPAAEHQQTESRSIAGRMVVLAVVAICTLVGLVFPFPVDGRLWNELFDLAHAPAFCGLLLIVAGFIDPSSIGLSSQAFRIRYIRSGELMVLSGACLMLGFLGEFLQAFVGRSPSAKDLVANAAGVSSGVFWIVSRRHRGKPKALFVVAAVLTLGLAIVSPVLGIRAAVQQRREFPLLASFERRNELQIWETVNARISRTSQMVSNGQCALLLEVFPGDFSGAVMTWPVQDWHGYELLSCDVRSLMDAPVMLTFKIYDEQHANSGFEPDDRFETTVEVKPGKFRNHNFRLSDIENAPATRTLDLRHIAGMELFVVQPQHAGKLIVDNIRLLDPSAAVGIPIDSIH